LDRVRIARSGWECLASTKRTSQFDPQKHHRRSIRLKGYDYTQTGAYFVTVCAQDRVCLFGDVADGDMVLNPFGRVAVTYWQRIPRHFPHVQLDAWVVMPNHVHGIIVITNGRGEALPAASVSTEELLHFETDLSTLDTGSNASPLQSGSLGAIVGNYKSITTRRINKMRHTPGERVWQRNYYERIIRNDRELDAIRQYIANNPLHWEQDPEYLV
jgi:REP element-mobilizing transposase RayT